MALFVMIVRRMAQNKWLVLSLFFGMLMTVALVATMPIYTEAILSRMLVKELEMYQSNSRTYPATHWSRINLYDKKPDEARRIMENLERFMAGEAAAGFGLPVRELVREKVTKTMQLTYAEPERNERSTKPIATVRSYSGLTGHIRLTDGRLPADKPVDGVYEALLTEQALNKFDLVLDTTVTLSDRNTGEGIDVKAVGILAKRDDADPYFRDAGLNDLTSAFVIDERLFAEAFVAEGKLPVQTAGWYFVLEYAKMELRNVPQFTDADRLIRQRTAATVGAYQADFKVPAAALIEKYLERADKLRALLWSLNVPVFIMLGFYMFMVANLIADRQRNEIAVLRSRGAARWQIAVSFAAEALLLGAVALALGPLLALKLTGLLGASNGFLEFVQRAALPVRVTKEAYLYGAYAAAAAFLMALAPIVRAARATIVEHKRETSRTQRTPLWHKSFLDVLALGLSIYGLYRFRTQMEDIRNLGLNADDLRIDALQFVLPSLFVAGGGLFLLRLYPFALRLIHWLGRKRWPAALYATLIQVGRANSQYQFLMLFLILTLATGLFSAGAARTLNGNAEERIRYANGADFVLQAYWPNDKPPPPAPGAPPEAAQETLNPNAPIHYIEPPFEPYAALPGVESAAKVFVKRDVGFSAGQENGSAMLIGIDTDDFGRTAWFPDRLLAYPFYDYLNLIAADSRAVLISRTLAEQKGVQVGSTLYAGWSGTDKQPFVVYGIIDYFPTFNPNPPTGSVDAADKESKANAPMLIVGHLSRIQLQLGLEPYEVWLKMKPGAATETLYEAIAASKLGITSVENTRELLTRAKNDPFMMALNGVLTLGFLVSVLICFVGFLLYWILSLKGRTLQNGILRAIGLSVRQLAAMLALEQLLTSGFAVLIGIGVGNLAGRLFVPNLQTAFNPGSLVPPFRTVFEAADFFRLYAAVGAMLLLGIGILAFMLSRIRVHQALKLGEG